MRLPRVLHLSAAPLSTGGVERFLEGLCASLRSQVQFGLLSAARPDFAARMAARNCETFAWSFEGLVDPRVLTSLARVLERFQPDLIHLHDSRAGFLPRIWLKSRGFPIISTVHLPPYLYRWPHFTASRRWLYGALEGFLNRALTDAVVYPSQSGYALALRHGYASRSQAHLIPNGIDLMPFQSLSQPARMSSPVICVVARLSPEKNVQLLLRAAALLTDLDFSLWIVGDGPERPALESLAAQLGLNPRVHFWGFQADLPALLAQADLFALTSWYEGGRSQAVMEAQAAGLPAVLSDVGDNALLASGQTALIFPEGDLRACAASLRQIISDKGLRRRMSSCAHAKALAEYGLPQMAQAYFQIYQQLLEIP